MNRKKNNKVAAVIDIGSNMLKMRISQLKKGEIVDIDVLEYPLSLGHEVFTEGKIRFESLRELSRVLHGYSSIMNEYGVDQCKVVATTAFRDAKNRSYVLDQLKIQNDITVQVLEDDQEKTLIYSEILNFLNQIENKKSENALISYIGAGTIGFSVYNGKHMVFSQNIPMGALKLHDMLGNIQELTEDFYTVVEEYLHSIIGHISIPFNKGIVSNLILTGNEIQLIAKICSVEPVNDCYTIPAEMLTDLFKKIRSMSQEKISLQYGINEETAELLYSALAIYISLIDFTTSDYIISPKVELWDALMRLMLIPKSGDEYFEHVRENAISCAQEIAKTYNCNQKHSDNIRKFACRIFDKMKGAHGLDHRKRLLLELAAILHDSGHYVTAKQHLLSAFDLIKDIDVYGMTDDEMLITAYVSRYNEYDVPNYDDVEFLRISDKNRLIVSKLVAIFRLANALDKSQKQKLKDIKVKLDNDKLLITAESNDNVYLERWAFEQCAPFFKEVFGYNPVLTIKSSLI
ncbi:Ppx/GppA phosphatase family protein [Caproiciproducens faecalis]|uniref:Phosphatase n=1 Tax=Caproiciproducens faecalis TaxID=2820301 RepID=A0ABS7DSV9_9FIRM|nr:phosphatase [Caproiciproducens faecalis]MBW7573661.1 phosphatase [Caproiciproducens faecalis]